MAEGERRAVLLRDRPESPEEAVDVENSRRRGEDRRRRPDVRLLLSEARERRLLEGSSVLPAGGDDLREALLLASLERQEPLPRPLERDVVRLAERREAPVPGDAEPRFPRPRRVVDPRVEDLAVAGARLAPRAGVAFGDDDREPRARELRR